MHDGVRRSPNGEGCMRGVGVNSRQPDVRLELEIVEIEQELRVGRGIADEVGDTGIEAIHVIGELRIGVTENQGP
jgi:hypothetical protein